MTCAGRFVGLFFFLSFLPRSEIEDGVRRNTERRREPATTSVFPSRALTSADSLRGNGRADVRNPESRGSPGGGKAGCVQSLSSWCLAAATPSVHGLA